MFFLKLNYFLEIWKMGFKTLYSKIKFEKSIVLLNFSWTLFNLSLLLTLRKYCHEPYKHLKRRTLQRYLAVNYCCKVLHLRCLRVSWLRIWYPQSFIVKYVVQKQMLLRDLIQSSLQILSELINFYSPLKLSKAIGFLMISVGIEVNQFALY